MNQSKENSKEIIEKKYLEKVLRVKILGIIFIVASIFSFFFFLSFGDPYIIPFDFILFIIKFRLGFPNEVNYFGFLLYCFHNIDEYLGTDGIYASFFYRTFQIWESLVIDIRMPRILLAFIVGMCLSVAGVVMQGIFRNPLADPYILGISSGGGLGATIAIYFNLAIVLRVWTFTQVINFQINNSALDIGYALTASDFAYKIAISLISFIFSLLITFLVYFLAKTRGEISLETLLLAGIALSYIFFSLTQLLLLFSREELHQMLLWGIGGFSGVEWLDVLIAGPIILIGSSLLAFYGKDINIMVFGDDVAKSMGTNVQKTRRNLIIIVSLITAVAVAFTGPIGFVGLICPHIVRLFIGNNHRSLMPIAGLFGGLFLIWMDFLAQSILGPGSYFDVFTNNFMQLQIENIKREFLENLAKIPAFNVPVIRDMVNSILNYLFPQKILGGDLPVGIITSLIGGPFFIILLLVKRKRFFR